MTITPNSSPWPDPTSRSIGKAVQTGRMTADAATDTVLVSQDEAVRVTREGGRIDIRLARPDVRNAQTPAMWRALADLGEQIDHLTPAPTAVVVAGEGASFSAGLDRRMFTPEGIPGEPTFVDLSGKGDDSLDTFIVQAQAAFSWWRRVDPITIAVVHGHAIGAGFQLALACDLVIAHPDAIFAMRETSWGLVPDLGGTLPLVRGAGYGPALEACATGRDITAEELHHWGLALKPIEDPAGSATELVERLAATPPGAVSALKHLLGNIDDRDDQFQRERVAQRDRLRAMARLLG